MVRGVLRGGLAFKVPGGPGEEVRVVDGPRDIELAGKTKRLAGLTAFRQGVVLRLFLQQARETGKYR